MSSARRHAENAAAYGAACRLHDVDDVLAYVQSVVARKAAAFDPSDREELMSVLLVETVHMSGIRAGVYAFQAGTAPKGVFDPGSGLTFSTWLGWQLPRRIIDWQRREKGDSRYRSTRRVIVSLEQPVGNDDGAGRTIGDRLASPIDFDELVDDRARLRSALDEVA